MLDEENTQWCPLGPFQSANEESLLCSRVFFCSGTHTPKQKDPGEGSNMKNDRLCKRTTPKHASTACTRLAVKNIANTHAQASFYIHYHEALDWMGNINIWSFPWNQRCIRPLNSRIPAEWWHRLGGGVLRPAWLGTEQTFPISPIHGRPGWPLRRAGPLSLDLRCGCSLWDSPALALSQKDREPENRYFRETGEVLAKLGFKKKKKRGSSKNQVL